MLGENTMMQMQTATSQTDFKSTKNSRQRSFQTENMKSE